MCVSRELIMLSVYLHCDQYCPGQPFYIDLGQCDRFWDL